MGSVVSISSILIVAVAVYQRLSRASNYQRLGKQLGLQFGNVLTPDIDLERLTFFSPIDWINNVLAGEHKGREIAVFDVHANHGDVGYKQTTVAIRSSASCQFKSAFWKASEIVCQRSGDWIILYREREELPVRQIPEFLDTCSQFVEYLECG